MRIDIITCLPELLQSFFEHSIVKRAKEKKIVELNLYDLRNYTSDKHRKTDDYPYGGEPGMVMMAEPIFKCIETLKEKQAYDEIIYLSPEGELLNQSLSNRLSMLNNIILLCGHYKGIDERVRQKLITKEISIGDYVLTGGELAAAVLSDSIIRILPGALSDETAALNDSFQSGLLDAPHYTRPADFRGMKVPDILLSGDEKKIGEWRFEQAMERTRQRKPWMLNDKK